MEDDLKIEDDLKDKDAPKRKKTSNEKSAEIAAVMILSGFFKK